MRWPALLVAAAIYAAAVSPLASQRLPRLFLPIVAAAGAIVIVGALARSLRRLVRARQTERRGHILPVAINAVATLVLVVSPAIRLMDAAVAANRGAPRTLAGFGDWRGGEGYPRLSPHRGVDIAARPGSDILAAAAGRVVVARDSHDACGLILVIVQEPHDYRTVYCHLAAFAVAVGEHVARGQRVGTVGVTGQRAWPGYEHVHLELQRGHDPKDVEDAARRFAGCFDRAAVYATDRLTLTYPIRC